MHDLGHLERRMRNKRILNCTETPSFINCFLCSTENLAECVNKVNETGGCHREGEVKLILHFAGGWHSTGVDLYTCCSYLVLHLLLKSETLYVYAQSKSPCPIRQFILILFSTTHLPLSEGSHYCLTSLNDSVAPLLPPHTVPLVATRHTHSLLHE